MAQQTGQTTSHEQVVIDVDDAYSVQPPFDYPTRVRLQNIFERYVKPENVLHIFHQYDIGVLTIRDIEHVRATTNNKGDSAGALDLFDRLLIYNGWWPCLLGVLCDKEVKLAHVAKMMKNTSKNTPPERQVQSVPSREESSEPATTAHNCTRESGNAAEADQSQRTGDKTLAIIGKTGYGKSKTGNSILGRDAFVTSNSTSSVTKVVDKKCCYHKGRHITVVDTPGVGDTKLKRKTALQSTVSVLSGMIVDEPNGYDAFLLTFKFGERFTQEDRDTLTLLRATFGKDFVGNHCILVITGGDKFEKEKDKNQSFRDWYMEQEGPFKDLVIEVKYRVILFDNSTQNSQVDELLEIVDAMPRGKYTNDMFLAAKKFREGLTNEGKEASFCRNLLRELDLVHQEFKLAQNKEDLKEQLECANAVRRKISELCNRKDLRLHFHRSKNKFMQTIDDIITEFEELVDEHIAKLEELITDKENQDSSNEEETRTQWAEWLQTLHDMTCDIEKRCFKVRMKADKYFWQTIRDFVLWLMAFINQCFSAPDFAYYRDRAASMMASS